MKLNKIELEKPYKYKKLCEIFEEEKKTGKSKQLQIKNWKRYVKLNELEKANFSIAEIYKVPLPKADGRKTGNTGKNPNSHGNNIGGEYTQYVQPLLKNYLSDNNKYKTIYVSNTQLGKYLGFITENFASALEYKSLTLAILKEKLGINNYHSYWDIIDKSKESYKGIIQYNLKKLQEEKLIKFKYDYIFILYKNDDYTYEYSAASKEDIIKIKIIENEILAELELKTKSDLVFCSEQKVKKFYKKFEDKVIKEFEVEGIFMGYEINILQDTESENITGYKGKINKKFQEKIYSNLSKLEDKAFDKMSNFQELTQKEEARVNDDYLNQCKVVIKELLSCNNTIHLKSEIHKKLKKLEENKDKIQKIKENNIKEKKKFKKNKYIMRGVQVNEGCI